MKLSIAFMFAVVFSATAFAQNNTVTSTVTGTTTVDKTPPTASAPNVVVNNQDVCTTAASAAIQTQILGIAAGKTVRDMNCERLKLSRSLYGMGMKVAAVSMLCQDDRVFDAMMMAGTPCPIDGKIGEQAKELWEQQDIDEALREEIEDTAEDNTWVIAVFSLLFFGVAI